MWPVLRLLVCYLPVNLLVIFTVVYVFILVSHAEPISISITVKEKNCFVVDFHLCIEILSHHQTVVEAGYNMNVAGEYGGYPSQASSGIMFPGQPFINDVVADVASQYGRQGTEFVHKNVSTVSFIGLSFTEKFRILLVTACPCSKICVIFLKVYNRKTRRISVLCNLCSCHLIQNI